MAPFCGWGSTNLSRLQSHYEEGVYFLPLSSQKFLVLTGFEYKTPALGIQCLNHYAIETLATKILVY